MTLKRLRCGLALIRSNLPSGVMRVDGLLCRTEDRRVHAGGERHAHRVVRRHRDDAGVGPDESVEVIGIAAHDVLGGVAGEERGLEHTSISRHAAGRAVLVPFELSPARVLAIDDAFEPDR